MIDAIHVLSNPIIALSKILYANSSFVDANSIRPQGVRKTDLEFLIGKATELEDVGRFSGPMAKYKQYMNGVFESLQDLRGRPVMFLDFENSCLEDDYGRYKNLCVDDFCSNSEVAPAFLKLYSKLDDGVKEAMRQMIFWRMSPYDFPFVIKDEQTIENPFSESARDVDDMLLSEEKNSLGSRKRTLEGRSAENYRFSKNIFSIQEFRKHIRNPNNLKWMNITYNDRNDHVSPEELQRLAESAIRINREAMKVKYREIISVLGSEKYAYMLNGDIGLELLSNAFGEIQVPGGKLIHNSKNIGSGGVLEDQALNRLSGWLNALYGEHKRAMQMIIPVVIKSEQHNEGTTFNSSPAYPFVKTIGSVREIRKGLKKIDKHALEILEKETKEYGFSIGSIESVFVRLNYDNFTVFTDDGESNFRTMIGEYTISPFDIADLNVRNEDRIPVRVVRPSNCSAKCELLKAINLAPDPDIPMVQLRETISGSTLHHISNQLASEQHKILPKFGIRDVARDRYCEIRVQRKYIPEETVWKDAENSILEKIGKTNNLFYHEMLQRLEAARNTGAEIRFDGSPDAVGIIEDLNQLFIVDFKRRMAGYYPVRSFFEQVSRYAFMILGSKQIDQKQFYAAIVQTPFNAGKFLDESQRYGYETGFKEQTIKIKQIKTDSEFFQRMKVNIALEFLGSQILVEDISKGHWIREMYKDRPSHYTPSCSNCFANKPGLHSCNYLLTGRNQIWEV